MIDNRFVIFYGAGAEAKRNLAKWRAQGLAPICFADSDESKHYTKFVPEDDQCEEDGGYDILPLDAAIGKYPDYVVYPTVAPHNIQSVTQFLLDRKIPEERIEYTSQYYKGLGCNHLGNCFVSYEGILTCVVVPCRYFGVKQSLDIEDLHRQYTSKTKSFIMDNMRGNPALCKDCYQLQHGIWEIEPQITEVNISSDPDDYCNSCCVYCAKYPKPANEKKQKREKYILDVAKYFTEKAAGKTFGLHISAGEISVSSYCDEVTNLVLEHINLYAVFSTNAIVYSQPIADVLATGRAELIVSLDSGTSETMRKVRGLDCFESSVRNCIRYAQHIPDKTKMQMKYIILQGINDNETDIRCFLDIVKHIGCVAVLSSNWRCLKNVCLSEHDLNMCYLFMQICCENDIAFRYVDYYFCMDDRAKLDKFRQKLQL